MCILVLISFKINVLHISTQVSGIVHSWSPGNVGLLFLPLTVILSLSFSSHQYHPLTSTSSTSITDKLKSLFPARHCEHNDKYQEKPDSLPLEVVKMWSRHNRERYRCMLYWERTVSQCQNNWEPRAHISFVGAGLHFLMENILANTTCGTLCLCNSNRKKNNGMITYTYFTVTLFVDAMNHLQLEKLRVFVSKIKNQKETFSCFAVIKHSEQQENKVVNIFLSQHLIFVQKYFSSASAIR